MGKAPLKPANSRPPEPLIPAECDLRGLENMLVDLAVFTSDLFALSSGDEFKTALALWGASYGQIPAGSLPDNNQILGHLSRTGTAFRKHREMALRGWVKCRDGLLYHPVLAEKVLVAWIGRLRQRKGSGESNLRQHGVTYDSGEIDRQLTAAFVALERVAPRSKELIKWRRAQRSASRGALTPGTQAEAEAEAEAGSKSPFQERGEIIHLGGRRA